MGQRELSHRLMLFGGTDDRERPLLSLPLSPSLFPLKRGLSILRPANCGLTCLAYDGNIFGCGTRLVRPLVAPVGKRSARRSAHAWRELGVPSRRRSPCRF